MNQQSENKKGFSLKQVLALSLGVMLLTIMVTLFTIKIWFFPQPFRPVVLDAQEEERLEQKLDRLESFSPQTAGAENDFNLNPEAYSEEGAHRKITFNEREVNSLLANNTDLAEKMVIDFAEDLISLRLLLPIDPDFPIMGGKTLRVRAGAELAYREGRPVVILKGVSLMGVPLPNAWLGGLKNIDLMQEFGGDPGFWRSFGEGIEAVRVREGALYIQLRK